MVPMATRLSQTSAISSAGSPEISTRPMVRPSTATGTSREATGGATSASNQAGAGDRAASSRVSALSAGGLAAMGAPAASFT